MRSVSTLSSCAFTFALMLGGGHSAFAEDVDLTYINEGIERWQFMIIDKDRKGIDAKDQVATWIKAAQTSLADGTPARSFRSVHVFSQCFSGGFLQALNDKAVANFSASSAGRYWEPTTYDTANSRSYFVWAWGKKFDAVVSPVDKAVTQATANALATGERDIPQNPDARQQRAQHLASDGAITLFADDRPTYAILYFGLTDEKDENDLDQVYNEIRDHGVAAANIMVLFGDELLYGGKKATTANLEWAWKTWLVDKINAQGATQTEADVIFFVGDHGNATSPITISVSPGTKGAAGSAIAAAVAAADSPAKYAWVAGNNADQSKRWKEPNGADIDAMAFGNDYSAEDVVGSLGPTETLLYFTVDPASKGAPKTELRSEVDAMLAGSSDVFVATSNSHRQLVDGKRSLKLEEDLNDDDIDALILRDITLVTNPNTTCISVPIFYSIGGGTKIMVHDPVTKRTYVYFDFATYCARNAMPVELDALAINDNGARKAIADPHDPMKTIEGLYFDEFIDEFLFSIGSAEANKPWTGFKPCDVLRIHPDGAGSIDLVVFRTCASMGLDPATDNVNGIDVLSRTAKGFRKPPSPEAGMRGGPDMNGDGFVDGDDLALLLSAWGPCEIICECDADLNGDGVVGGLDLALVLGAWSS